MNTVRTEKKQDVNAKGDAREANEQQTFQEFKVLLDKVIGLPGRITKECYGLSVSYYSPTGIRMLEVGIHEPFEFSDTWIVSGPCSRPPTANEINSLVKTLWESEAPRKEASASASA